MARPIDVSAGTTSLQAEPVRQSAVDVSGEIAGRGAAQAADITSRGILAQAQAAENFAQIAPEITKTGLAVREGMAKAELDKKINNDLTAWIQARENPEEVKLGLIQSDILDEQANDVWQKLNEGKISPNNFTSTINAFDDQITRLRAAHDQGMLSPSEMVARLQTTIREHVSRNPGLADELYNHGQRSLQLSGITSLRDMKREEQDTLLKAREQGVKTLVKGLQDNGIAFDPLTVYSDEGYQYKLSLELQNKVRDKSVYDSYKQGFNLNKLVSEQEKTSFFVNDAPSLYREHSDAYKLAVVDILNSGVDDNQQLLALEALNRDTLDQQAQLFQTKGVASHADSEKYRRDLENYTKATFEQIKDAKSLETKLKIIENQNKLTVELSKNELYKDIDPGILELLRLVPTGTMEAMLLRKGATGESLLNTASRAMDKMLRSPQVINDLFTKEGAIEPGKTNGSALMAKLMADGQLDVLDKITEGYAESLRAGTIDEIGHMNNMVDFNVIINRPEIIKQIKELSPEGKRNMQEINNNYMVLLARSFEGFRNKEEFKSSDFRVEELPNGSIQFISDDKNFESKLNKIYGDKFNAAVKGSAAIFGQTTQQVSKNYQAFFGSTFKIGSEIGGVGIHENLAEDVDRRVAAIESSLDPNIKNPDSEALGIGQFIPKTWMSVMTKFFPKRIEGLSREEILDLRRDKDLSMQAIAALRKDNTRQLKNANLPITNHTIYLAHALGGPEAIKLLKAHPGEKISKVLDKDTIGGHPWLQGSNKIVADAIGFASRKMNTDAPNIIELVAQRARGG